MAIVKSARRSVRRHSAAIELSDRIVRRILHKDFNFHPYKIAIVQELSDRDMAKRRISSAQLGLLEKYPTFGREKETGLLGALDT